MYIGIVVCVLSVAFVVCAQMVTYGQLHDKAAALARVLTQVWRHTHKGACRLRGLEKTKRKTGMLNLRKKTCPPYCCLMSLSLCLSLCFVCQSCGVGVEGLVCVRVDRSVGLVVGVLGVLLAKAAYVPIDPTHPIQR